MSKNLLIVGMEWITARGLIPVITVPRKSLLVKGSMSQD